MLNKYVVTFFLIDGREEVLNFSQRSETYDEAVKMLKSKVKAFARQIEIGDCCIIKNKDTGRGQAFVFDKNLTLAKVTEPELKLWRHVMVGNPARHQGLKAIFEEIKNDKQHGQVAGRIHHSNPDSFQSGKR